MTHVLLLILSFVWSAVTLGGVTLCAVYDAQRYTGQRDKRFRAQLGIAGIKLAPHSWNGTYRKRDYDFTFTRADCPTIEITTSVHNPHHVTFHIIRATLISQPIAARVITGHDRFDREFITTSDPESWVTTLFEHSHHLPNELRQVSRLILHLEGSTLTLYPNVLDESALNLFDWRLYLDILRDVAQAMERI